MSDDDLRESDNVTKHGPRSIYKVENDSSAIRLTEAYSLGSQHTSSLLDLHVMVNRPFSKMADENSNRSILNTYSSTRKNTFTLVTLPSFSISGVISAEKM